MYLVKFVRRDRQPDEEYFYNNRQDAEYHFNLFQDDDSNLYRRIDLLKTSSDSEIILGKIQFPEE